MSMPTLVVIHGRDRRWPDHATLARAWEAALRSALERAGAPYANVLPVRFVDYGAPWRDLDHTDDIAPIQADFATELLERSGATAEGWSMWGGFGRLVQALDQDAGIGDEAAVEALLSDLAEYFRDDARRAQANEALAGEAAAADGEVIFLAHGIGSIVSYLALHERREDLGRVRGLVTVGSPLGMDAVRRRIEAIVPGAPFPHPPRRWVNLFHLEDFATGAPMLASIFEAADGRRVEDQPVADGAKPPGGRGRAHEALTYLGSSELASRLQELVGELEPTAEPPAEEAPDGEPREESPPEPTSAEPPATRSWPGGPAAPGASPPWLDGAAPPWIDPDEDEDK